MIYILIFSCFFTAILQATEHAPGILLPEIPMRQPALEGAKTRKYFEERWKKKKEEVHIILTSILPAVLAGMIEGYRTTSTGKWETMKVQGLVYDFDQENEFVTLATVPSIFPTNETLHADIPVRYDEDYQPCQVHHRDIFAACLRLLNQSTGVHWVRDLYSPWLKQKLQEFLSGTITHPCRIDFMNVCTHQTEINFHFIDHFPLGIYFGQEIHMLTKIKPPSIRQYPAGDYSHAIDEACHEILEEHGKIPPTTKKENLIIACTACNKHIAFPKKNCDHLLMRHHGIQAGSPQCNGKDPLCRSFRALRVYLPEVPQKTVEEERTPATSKSRKRKESGLNLQIIIPDKRAR